MKEEEKLEGWWKTIQIGRMEEKDTDWEDERGGEIGGMVENDTDWRDGRKLGGYCRDGEKNRYGFEG